MKVNELLNKPSVKYGLAGLATSFVAFFAWMIVVPVYHEYQSSFAAKEFRQYGVLGTYKKHFFSFLGNLDEMRELDADNIRLNQKLAALEMKIEVKEATLAEHDAERVTHETSERLKKESGSELARVLSSIEYRPPSHLLPNELYVLGLGYFRKGEYEQAAVIFSQLIHMKEESAYQKPQNYLMCGISWYKIKELRLAEENFSAAKKTTTIEDPIYRTADLWNAFLFETKGKKHEAQEVLTSMIARFPHSDEVQWVNGNRKPAAKDSYHEQAENHVQHALPQDEAKDEVKPDAHAKGHEDAHPEAPAGHTPAPHHAETGETHE